MFVCRDHSELTTITNDMVIGELKWTELAIKEVLGVTPRLMRPVSPTILPTFFFLFTNFYIIA